MDTAIILSQSNNGLELALAAWMDAKNNRSGSAKTARAYQDTMTSFREALGAIGLDLDSPTAAVALTAQGWAGKSEGKSGVEPTTYNQRLAILSSFYNYARKQGLFQGENPIGRVERRTVQSYAHAEALDYADLKTRLAAIERAGLVGKRDYAMLSIAVQTGRRLSEIAGLRRGDVKLSGDSGKVLLYWRRMKGGKTMSDALPLGTSKALMDWLSTYYGQALGSLANDAPVWVSLSRRNPGAALSIQTVADICQRRLGVSTFHSLRHTFARAMEDTGAKVSEIQARLSHKNLATTGLYLAALKQSENKHADQLAHLFGLD